MPDVMPATKLISLVTDFKASKQAMNSFVVWSIWNIGCPRFYLHRKMMLVRQKLGCACAVSPRYYALQLYSWEAPS
jgi:hypothetical protein